MKTEIRIIVGVVFFVVNQEVALPCRLSFVKGGGHVCDPKLIGTPMHSAGEIRKIEPPKLEFTAGDFKPKSRFGYMLERNQTIPLDRWRNGETIRINGLV